MTLTNTAAAGGSQVNVTNVGVTGGSAFTGLPFISGDVTPSVVITATPEPSSIALLGTGMLALVGVVRNRKRLA